MYNIDLQDLHLQNPWWDDGAYDVPESAWFHREIYDVLIDNLSHPLIINLIGLRRVGKSTVLKQLIAHLLGKKNNPLNVYYFLFDYASQIKNAEFLEKILDMYFKDVLQITINNLKERIYIFLDEIQYIEDWQVVLKKYYDLSNKKIKFVISGSQSLLLQNKSHESLAGRIFDYYLAPLTLREFIAIHTLKIKTLEKFDLFDLPKKYSALSNYHLHYGAKIKELISEYIISGHFPETHQFTLLSSRHEYVMESVLGKILEDCIRIFKIDKANEFKLITYHLLSNAGSIFEMQNLCREIGIVHATLEKYLEYLQSSYVVEILYKYHKSLIKRGRILKKLYATNVNFICALRRYKAEHIDEIPEAFGKVIENLLYNVLAQKYQYSEHEEIANRLSFWRDGEKEIDFLVSQKNIVIPIEVKFSNNITSKNLQPLIKFLANKNVEFGIVATKEILEKRIISGKNIYFIPYYLLLFLV